MSNLSDCCNPCCPPAGSGLRSETYSSYREIPFGFCLRDELTTGGGFSDYEAVRCYPSGYCDDLFTFHGINTLDWDPDACCWNTLPDLDGPCFLAIPPSDGPSKGTLVDVKSTPNDKGRGHSYFSLRVGKGLERPLVEGEIRVGERPHPVTTDYCTVTHQGTDRLVKLFWIETVGKPTGIGYEIKSKEVANQAKVTFEQIGNDNVGMVYREIEDSEMRENYFVILAKEQDE